MTHRVPYVCPRCLGPLTEHPESVSCDSCHATYSRLSGTFADFVGPEVSFDDWWTTDESTLHHWLEHDARQEEEYEVGLTRNYLLPLLQKLRHPPGQATLLSAGCGLASDVQMLNDAGYDAWGIDIGNRVRTWGRRRVRDRLARADLRQMPFPDESFDLVTSLNTLEHIGTFGDTSRVTPDYLEQRLAAVRSMLRVTKRGGHLLLTGLNRSVPFDFAHVQEVRWVRIHSPWERFLLSYSDVRKLCERTGDVDQIRSLPLRGFFSWTRLRHSRIARPILPAVDWLFGCMPEWVYGTCLSPFWIALIQRKGG
ncbi:MAG TPA: class I SAM-dependent methyltransferase [Pirellulaceae bacterium]